MADEPTPAPSPAPAPAPSSAADALNPGGGPAPASAPAPPASPAPAPAPAPAPSVPDYMASWPDELRSDPDLTRYQSPEDMAKGLKETRAWARGRIPIPTDEAGFKELGEKLRPESADKYEFKVAEGEDRTLVDAFGQFAFDQGLPKQWAEGTVNFYQRQLADAQSKMTQANSDEIKSVELELGAVGYNTRLDAVNNMFEAAGVDGFDVATGLQSALGADGKPAAGKVMRALFTLAEKYGELEKVDGASVELRMGTMTPEQAGAEAQRMLNNDPEGKLAKPDSPERKKYDQLLARAAQG